MPEVNRRRGAKIFRQHPIISNFAETVLSESLSLAEEIGSLDPKRFVRKNRSLRIPFDQYVKLQSDHWDLQIDGVLYGAKGALIDLDEDELEESEFDVLIVITFCALDEIGVFLKHYLSAKSAEREENFSKIKELVARIYENYENLVRVHDAFSKATTNSINAVYNALSTTLKQADAPFLFRVDKDILDVPLSEQNKDHEAIDPDALSALRDQVNILAASIESSNIDPRLGQIVAKYAASLESDLSVVRLELYANEIRALLSSLKDEISSPVLVSGTALILSHEQVMRHSSRWRNFVESPPLPRSNVTRIEKDTTAILQMLGIATFRVSVSERTRVAASDLQDASRIDDAEGRISDAVLKSIVNLIKANVKYSIGLIKKGYIELNGISQRVYFSLFLRLLPHFKLICTYTSELAWLVPISDYIQGLNSRDAPESKKKNRRK